MPAALRLTASAAMEGVWQGDVTRNTVQLKNPWVAERKARVRFSADEARCWRWFPLRVRSKHRFAVFDSAQTAFRASCFTGAIAIFGSLHA